jgi:exonuclease SbcC
VVAALPGEAPPADLAAVAATVEAAEAARAAPERARSTAAAELAPAVALRAEAAGQVERLDGRLEGCDRPAVAADLESAAAAAERLATATAAAKEARRAEKAARQAAAAAAAAVDEARHRFDAARDGVAGLGAPARTGDDLAAEWAALASWAAAEAPGRRSAAAEAVARAEARRAERAAMLRDLAERCAASGVEVAPGAVPRERAAEALAGARAVRDELVRRLADAERVEAERQDVAARRDVAGSLATHLDARHFEKWVLDEALGALAAGATELLRTLSGGHYSLAVDGRGSFVVVDHHNADEPRPARTLSGGETFLASLALALALADRIAASATAAAPRLDAIFLDEGFGTLDPDALDVVATAIEELGAAGRMVGVVSHVAELAERVPVRFEVARRGGTSTVTRIDR